MEIHIPKSLVALVVEEVRIHTVPSLVVHLEVVHDLVSEAYQDDLAVLAV